MRDAGMRLLDVQWLTEHLESLGAVELSRERYLALLADALAGPGAAFKPYSATPDE
jgi:leucyl/phenylalanyl-tRNA--protein transferase